MADNKSALQVIEQRDITFYGDKLTAVRAADGHIYVALSQMCQALGIDDDGQRQRIRRHTVLNSGLGACKLQTPGGVQDAFVLRADVVPLWLSGIRTAAVNQDMRPKLERFQQEAAKVLWEAFQEGRLTTDPAFDELLQTAANSETVQAYQIAAAVMKLARQQILIEARLSGRLDVHESQLIDHDNRLEAIETSLSDTGRNVTPDQASQISQAVKAIALALGKKTGRNKFGSVYGELYRKFGITGYKMLPARRFDEAMAFLTEWYEQVTGETTF